MPDPHRKPFFEKFKAVSIQFLRSGEDALDVQAEVRRREDEMVISIQDQPFSGPYLVRGIRSEHFFAGVDSLKREDRVDVRARWTSLGDVYVGIWIEEGADHLFSFRVPRKRLAGGTDNRR
jgi:hypothetical protein